MKTKLVKLLIPTVVIVATIIIVMFIKGNPPKAKRFGSAPKATISVAVETLKKQDYQITIDSFGTVKPHTQSLLVAQASGQIIAVSDDFREGGFFSKGEVLLQLDDRDHQAEVKSAQAALLTAEQGLLEEKARGEQALIDWQRLGNKQQANSLVLREPQLAAAKAEVLSAQAALEKAQLDLERTKITAPYDGRILSRNVDLGQVVNENSELASIYAIDSVEIRLPIKNKDLPFIRLPEQFRDGSKKDLDATVKFTSDLVGEQVWQGKIVRTEGAIDETAQQLYVVGQITDPYKAGRNNQYPVKVGQYVKAEITGKVVPDALIIPNSTIYQGSYVYIVQDNVLQRKEITFLWQNAKYVMIKSGLSAGDKLVTTPLGQVSSGTAVDILGEPSKQKNSSNKSRPSREQLEKQAKEQGISVEELMKKRRAQRQGGKQ
ncbi:efflux RND transporter periplasmic adaptor subunit [Pseudoalteromonas sp. MMG010]|uniref:efflux RND transporter periplasmic adaptor subunit n=1 Tax=Pseudoalteromonas sp. MMG010 TaxID=2822685 RepID=UPI001B39DFE2|nr:efflux RND transporter periplasmic adaptor subunit [Pseudoalteromonas sp. MMG010]MBQ4834031.1 efflux RND transporter periplasmic adaptor subunit [Pseudoalteromonas sp. MMG010]